MNCPVCIEVPLALAERKGVEIDYCPTCRGVWLDRGELDRIISAVEGTSPPPAREDRDRRDDRDERDRRDDRDRDDRDRNGSGSRSGRRKKESFLSDFFDFG